MDVKRQASSVKGKNQERVFFSSFVSKFGGLGCRMFLSLNHKNLDTYKVCKTLVLECYKATSGFPPEEKYALVSQIRRAATSILLNLAEGSSRKSKAERVRFYEVSRGSLVEIDAALEISSELGYLKNVELTLIGDLMKRCFNLITALINSSR